MLSKKHEKHIEETMAIAMAIVVKQAIELDISLDDLLNMIEDVFANPFPGRLQVKQPK